MEKDTITELFIRLAKERDKSESFDKRKCEDQFVGLLKIERRNARFCQWLKCSLSKEEIKNRTKIHNELSAEKDIPIILIVLESPHKDEFETVKYNIDKPMPAMATTGDKLCELLPKYINRINSTFEDEYISKGMGYMDMPSGIYRVLLVNSIQYQCSLGEGTKKYRNEIFNAMWMDETVRENFAKRISLNNIKVVINSSTSGKNGNKFKAGEETIRKKVQNAIDLVVNDDVIIYHSLHPSCWQDCLGIEPNGWDG